MFYNDQLNGYARILYEDGSYYIGTFFNNQFDGYGTLSDSEGDVIHQGYFKNGKFINED